MPQPAPSPPSPPRTVLRHHWLVRLTHWTNALAVFFLLMTGLNIFGAHPRLYWGNAGSVEQLERRWLEIGVSGTMQQPQGWLEVTGRRFDTTGLLGASTAANGTPAIVAFPPWATFPSVRDLATARTWHFFMAWLLVVNGAVALGGGLASGHVVRDLLPRPRELAPRHLWHDIVQHLKLDFPKGEAALRYEVLQKLAYAGVALVLLPLVILTGMTMSPGFDAAFPWLDQLWGGRQSARSLHFLAASAIALFIAVHLLMVLLSGPIRQVGAMITGRLRITPEAR